MSQSRGLSTNLALGDNFPVDCSTSAVAAVASAAAAVTYCTVGWSRYLQDGFSNGCNSLAKTSDIRLKSAHLDNVFITCEGTAISFSAVLVEPLGSAVSQYLRDTASYSRAYK